jgi:hypothetical protein
MWERIDIVILANGLANGNSSGLHLGALGSNLDQNADSLHCGVFTIHS